MSGKNIEIYEWRVNVEDYESLTWVDEHYGKLDEPFANSQRFGASWRSRVLLRCNNPSRTDRPISDTPKADVAMRILSRRGLDMLRDLVEPSCEILPLDSTLGEFWAINCINETPCIDLAKSRYRTDSAGRVAELYDWAFEPDHLPCVHVFRVPESCVSFLVTRAFVDRVKVAKLLGFRLNLLWSLHGGPVERESAIRGTYKNTTEPWELEEIRRLKSEICRQRKEVRSRKHKQSSDE